MCSITPHALHQGVIRYGMKMVTMKSLVEVPRSYSFDGYKDNEGTRAYPGKTK
jgi:hypothetical protein